MLVETNKNRHRGRLNNEIAQTLKLSIGSPNFNFVFGFFGKYCGMIPNGKLCVNVCGNVF